MSGDGLPQTCRRDAARIAIATGIGKRRLAARQDAEGGDLGKLPFIGTLPQVFFAPRIRFGKPCEYRAGKADENSMPVNYGKV